MVLVGAVFIAMLSTPLTTVIVKEVAALVSFSSYTTLTVCSPNWFILSQVAVTPTEFILIDL